MACQSAKGPSGTSGTRQLFSETFTPGQNLNSMGLPDQEHSQPCLGRSMQHWTDLHRPLWTAEDHESQTN